jgi:transglutaminase-like putative cysteine protease
MLMIEAVRSLGMAARFVSGYLYLPDDNDIGYTGGGNMHAWVQVYLPGPGWLDFDPASGIVGNRDLIRDYLEMTVEVKVTAADAEGANRPARTCSGMVL